jgi:hypothetical protein
MTKKNEPHNSIAIGEIQLESSVLSIDQLISRMTTLLQNPTIKEYLSIVERKKYMNGGSYCG